jgi:hypothetical protein
VIDAVTHPLYLLFSLESCIWGVPAMGVAVAVGVAPSRRWRTRSP